MLRGFLVVEAGGPAGKRIPVPAPGEDAGRPLAVSPALVIGRSVDCGFVIEDTAASRRHVSITARGDSFHWRDLGSMNGTTMNGARMLEGVLKPGDRIGIGETVLRFEVEEAAAPETPSAELRFPDADPAVNLLETISYGHTCTPVRPAPGKSDELLCAIYAVMNAIAANYEPCDLLDRILESTMDAIHAPRGGIFFADGPAGGLSHCPVCGRVHVIRNGRVERVDIDAIRISKTVARRVLEGGESGTARRGERHGAAIAVGDMRAVAGEVGRTRHSVRRFRPRQPRVHARGPAAGDGARQQRRAGHRKRQHAPRDPR
ncbi:MAG: FHA domain-containing protein [Candidatus Hydrogenedentes bacterium]|nr:FHA domain-containing protein [Candidatus Hydrogenedentota bacterium]